MRLNRTPLILLFIIPFLNSCINNADFDQVNINAEPILNFPLVYFELNQLDFLDDTGTIEIPTITDVTDVEVFSSSTVRENLGRVDLIYQIENEFERGFIFEIDFLDDAGNVTYSFQNVTVPSGLNFIEIRENIVIAENPAILNTTQIRVQINLSAASTTLDPDVERRIEFRSTGVFYLFF